MSSKTKFVSGKVFYNRVSDAFMGPGNHEFQVNPVKFTKTCKIPLTTVQLRSRWPTHPQNLCTFFCILRQKKLVKGCVLSAFLLLFLNAVIMLCSAWFQKTGFLSQKAATQASNQRLHILTSKGCKMAAVSMKH